MVPEITEPVEVLAVGPSLVTDAVGEGLDAVDERTRLHATDDPHEALDRLSKTRGEGTGVIVVLDLQLEDGRAFAFLDFLREETSFARVPVVALHEPGATSDVATAYQLQVNASVPRNENRDALVDRLGRCLSFWLETARLPPVPS